MKVSVLVQYNLFPELEELGNTVQRLLTGQH